MPLKPPSSLLLRLAAFGCCFAPTHFALSSLEPWPDPARLRPKAEHYFARAAELDLVFIGSSRVLRGFDPEVFDGVLAGHGLAHRSFNFGIGGMRGHEADQLLKRVLEDANPPPRVVLMEFPDFDPEFMDGATEATDRSLFWHSIAQTLSVLRSTFLRDAPLADNVALAATHLRHCAAATVHYGRAASVAEHLLGRAPAARNTPGMLERRGFDRLADLDLPLDERQRRFLAPGARIMEQAAPAVTAENAAAVDLARYNLDALEEQIRLAEHYGVRLIYVAVPSVRATPVAYRLAEQGRLPAFVGLNDPTRCPQLYTTGLFLDAEHLNDAGAAAFSRVLASAVAPLLADR